MAVVFYHTKKGMYNHLIMCVDDEKVGDSHWKDFEYADDIFKTQLCFDEYPVKAYSNLAFIDSFFIEKEHRGKKYSHKLIRETLKLIRQEKRRHIALFISPYDDGLKKRPLLKLYKKFKFKRIMYTDIMLIIKK